MDSSSILAAARRLSEAQSTQALAEILERYPELKSQAVDHLLTQAIQGMTVLGNQQEVCTLLAVRAFLANYSVDGLDAARSRFELPLVKACPLTELARDANDPAQLPQRIVQARQALHQLRRETEPIWWATTQYVLGQALAKTPEGDHARNLKDAAAHYEQALDIWQSNHSFGDWRETLLELDQVWEEYAQLDPANHMGEAIAFYEKTLPTTDRLGYERALLLHTLGNLYCQRPVSNRAENIERAIECYKEVLAFPDVVRSYDPKHWVITQADLANAFLDRVYGERAENIEHAIIGYQAALQALPSERSEIVQAQIHYNLAVAHRLRQNQDRAQNVEKAIQHVQIAMRVFTKEAYPSRWATIQNELATLHCQRVDGNREENLEHAIQYYQAALTVYTRQSFPVQWAQTLNNLANAYCDLDHGRVENHRVAVQLYRLALEVRTQDEYPLEWADTQQNVGTAYAALDDLKQAETCYRSALQVYRAASWYAGVRRTASNWGRLHTSARQWARAQAAYDEAIRAAETLYRASATPIGKRAELAENVTLYHEAAFVAARNGKIAQALLTLDRGKTRLLNEALRLQMSRPVEVPDQVWTAFRKAGDEVRAAQSENTSRLDQERYTVQSYTDLIEAARKANNALESAIARVQAYAPNFMKQLEMPAVRSLLTGDDAALVAFCVASQGSLGLIISRRSGYVPQIVFVPAFTTQSLHDLIQGTEHHSGWIKAFQNGKIDVWKSAIDAVLERLGRDLLSPVLAALPADVTRLTLLPAGSLFLLPLHAAPLYPDGNVRVCDRYQISYAPSAEVLISLQAKAKQSMGCDLYMVVNPEQDPKLAFTSIEGESITRLFAQSHVDHGRAGIKDAVIAGVRGCAYLHFSCHGSYNWNDPPQSGLDLADGRLTLADLQSGVVDVSAARLVTLSACETGVTDILKGSADEYVGLPAGFMLSGVPCVVSSLWSVPDFSTALLMDQFYRSHLKNGLDLVAALRSAQQWVRRVKAVEVADYADRCYNESKDKNKTELFKYARSYRYLAQQDPDSLPFAHPYHWAAFTVSGM